MKKLISLILVIMLIITSVFTLTACDDDDECPICGGSGYYQKKDCPGCP